MWVHDGPFWINLYHASRVEVVERRPGEEPRLSLNISQPGVPVITITGKDACQRVLAWLEREVKSEQRPKHEKAA